MEEMRKHKWSPKSIKERDRERNTLALEYTKLNLKLDFNRLILFRIVMQELTIEKGRERKKESQF